MSINKNNTEKKKYWKPCERISNSSNIIEERQGSMKLNWLR